jgi:hypothetical protein
VQKTITLLKKCLVIMWLEQPLKTRSLIGIRKFNRLANTSVLNCLVKHYGPKTVRVAKPKRYGYNCITNKSNAVSSLSLTYI